jgi:hypothetical protein
MTLDIIMEYSVLYSRQYSIEEAVRQSGEAGIEA